jgi:hypothetical protein
VKGAVAIRLNGHASKTQVSQWERCIQNIFKPGRSIEGGDSERLLRYYLCDIGSGDQVKDLTLEVGGVVLREADEAEDGVELMTALTHEVFSVVLREAHEAGGKGAELGKYWNCIFEIPDEGEASRLEAPPNTVQVVYSGLPASLEHLRPPQDGRTYIALLPNHNGPEPDVTLATFMFEPPGGREGLAIPTTLGEAVDTLIRLMGPKQRKRFRQIPRERLVEETHRSMGMGIRNGWRLWDESSPLMRQFPGKEADDVSSIVIEAAWDKLEQASRNAKIGSDETPST